MTNEELVALIQEGTDVTENMGLLYQQNIGLIKKLLKPTMKSIYGSAVIEVEDLLQEAYFGLVDAVNKYDPTTEVPFMAYASDFIKFAAVRYKQNFLHLSRVPEYQLQFIGKYKDYVKAYSKEHDRKPSDEEIAQGLNIPLKKVKDISRTIDGMLVKSFEEPVKDTDEACLGDSIESDFSVEDFVIENEIAPIKKGIVWGCVSRLKEREIAFVRKHYVEEQSLQTIGSEVGLTYNSMYALREKVLKELRKMDELKAVYFNFDYESESLKNSSFGSWKNTWESSVEKAVFRKIYKEKYFNATVRKLVKWNLPILQKLNPKDEQILKLKYIDKLTVAEICSIMGFPTGSYGYQLKKAIEALERLVIENES